MSRLLSLYRSLSDDEISRLKTHIIKSQGVRFLNSSNEGFLFNLASAERLEDLDAAVVAVSRLGEKCTDFGLHRFDLFYRELKLGVVHLGKHRYGSRGICRTVRKMEKLVSATSYLHSALEELTEMEMKVKAKVNGFNNGQTEDYGMFLNKLENQRKEVCYLKEISLWCKSFDKSVDLMVKLVSVLYARIRSVFASNRDYYEKLIPYSGPISTTAKPTIVRFYSRKSFLFDEDADFKNVPVKFVKSNKVFHAAGRDTVGGSGLSLRYANLILMAEEYLESMEPISHSERESLYGMLPENLKALVRAKLSRNMKCLEEDASLAEGWRDATAEIMTWLAPMARDTITWQTERSFEKTKLDFKPCVLLLQTLHFSDKEKTEAAIAEVLVGLSCILRLTGN